MSVRKAKTRAARTLPQPLPPTPTPPLTNPPPIQANPKAKAKSNRPARAPQSRRAQRRADRVAAPARRAAEACAQLPAMPVQNRHAAGMDVGDASPWVCVESTRDGSDTVREFPAHTPGLRHLVDWLRACGVTPVAREASGVYGHVLFLTLREAGCDVVLTAPKCARPSQGRPQTDKRDGQWSQRLHQHGLLPRVFQPDEATQTLRDYVRPRANLGRLSGQHIQRLQKALELMHRKLTKVLGDITGVTGRKIIRALLAGERDPPRLAQLRDRRCKPAEPAMAQALDGRSRPEHVTELRCCLALWEKYQEVIAELDTSIAAQLRSMRRQTERPPLPPQPRVRGRTPHDPKFDVRTAWYYLRGVDLTASDGIDELHALTLVSELGTDFTKWPTVKQFTSWLGLCPNGKKPGGQVQSSHTRRGQKRAARALRLAAWSLLRSHSVLGVYLRRQRSRWGAPQASTATAHKLARIVDHLGRDGLASGKQTAEAYAEQVRQRLEKQLRRRAKELGFAVHKIEPAGVPQVE